MRLGYNTNGFGSHRLRDALEVIAGLGYRSVGLTLDAGALDPFEPTVQADAREVGKWLRERDLVPVVETGARFLLDPWKKHWPTLLSPEPADRSRRTDFLRRSIDVAVEVGAGVVSFWSGTPETNEEGAALDDRLATEIRSICDLAAAAGVRIGFEPEPGMWIEDMPAYERLRALVDHPAFALTLDVGHAHITEASAPDTVRRYAADIVNVHLEGMNRARHDHLLPGEGDIDLPAIVTAFDDIGYDGPATLELSRHSHMAVEAATQAAEYFRTLDLELLRQELVDGTRAMLGVEIEPAD